MRAMIGLDFETYGAVNLPEHGLDRYVTDPTFQPLIGAAVELQNGVFLQQDWEFYRAQVAVHELAKAIGGKWIVAHNAEFEQRTLAKLGLHYPSHRFIDSAVIARAMGASSHLEGAAPQLLDAMKIEAGKDLIKLFSIPGKYQEKYDTQHFHSQVIIDHPDEWREFRYYCQVDARLGLRLALEYLENLSPVELQFQAITMDMNLKGWPVDRWTIEEMQRRYLENQERALEEFRQQQDAAELNLNSLKQLKEWCADRGIKATSFAEDNVIKLKARIEKKLDSGVPEKDKREGYEQVHHLLETKLILGGSSLKKLKVILNTVTEDEEGTTRLRGQYLHCGAGQTLRTSGRSVQMQNLKRLTTIEDMAELEDPDSDWSNTKLAENLRQGFTSKRKDGMLIVGDFSSVESRGLAYLAEEDWKLAAYRQNKDMYKVLAEQIFNVSYDDVLKTQRQTGKVGELSCGYGAGADAVVSFAEGMGVQMTAAEAARLVSDWRTANPKVVDLWQWLDDALHAAVSRKYSSSKQLKDGFRLIISPGETPASLLRQHPGAQSIEMVIWDRFDVVFMRRIFHGCYVRGRNVCYYKPTKRKTGDLWSGSYVHPKTKQLTFYSLYGGKLSGILTQSFCRELFFRSLIKVHDWVQKVDNLDLIGQFHDEIVLDWWPADTRTDSSRSLEEAEAVLKNLMSDSGEAVSFPLAADIKHDYRYTK